MTTPFKGTINVDIRESEPDWSPFEPPKAPDGAPNVVYIVLDDVGFSAMAPYGGPIETPNIDRIANDGVRYTQWHTTALCSPTRSCLLTGRNHTRNSMACITEGASGFPNASGTIPPENGMLSEILGELGMEHLHRRQVASVPDRRDERRVDPTELAHGPRVRALLRVPRGRDEPVVSGAGVRQPSRRPTEEPGGGLPLHRRHHRQGARVHQGRQGARAGQAVLPLLRAGRRPRAPPRRAGMERSFQGPVRHGLRGDTRADARTSEGAGDRPRRDRAPAGQPDRHVRVPDRTRWATLPTARRHATVGLPERRREAAVRPDGRGLRGVPGARRPPHRSAARLPGGDGSARQHDRGPGLGQRRQRGGRAERFGQREPAVQRYARTT